jgi:hypothetical protein
MFLCQHVLKKEVFWKDIAYKFVARNKGVNEMTSISFYNSERKKLISFDKAIVGFDKVVRMAKRIPKLK